VPAGCVERLKGNDREIREAVLAGDRAGITRPFRGRTDDHPTVYGACTGPERSQRVHLLPVDVLGVGRLAAGLADGVSDECVGPGEGAERAPW
jgi:hypothetical protein